MHLFTPTELACAHGYPTPSEAADEFDGMCLLDLRSMSVKAQRHIVGKGSHLAAEGIWYSYILSNIIRKDMLEHSVPVKCV